MSPPGNKSVICWLSDIALPWLRTHADNAQHIFSSLMSSGTLGEGTSRVSTRYECGLEIRVWRSEVLVES